MKWYKRDPDAALNGMAVLSLAERGAYNSLLDILYCRDGDVPDDDLLVARMMRCHWRQWRKIKAVLISHGKVWSEGGKLKAKRVADTIKEAADFAQEQRRKAARTSQECENVKENNTSPEPSTTTPTTTTIEEKKESCRIADAIPTSVAISKSKPRLAYDGEFETFWKDYPTTRNMSKKEAWDVWKHLSPEDRVLAIDAVPKYKSWLAGKGDKAPEVIHACRFLSKRRFEGHAQAASASPASFYAAFCSPELEAWDAYGRMTKGRTFPKDRKGGWSFESRWPPGFDPGEQKLAQEQGHGR